MLTAGPGAPIGPWRPPGPGGPWERTRKYHYTIKSLWFLCKMHHHVIYIAMYLIGTHLFTLVSFASFLTVLSNLTLKKSTTASTPKLERWLVVKEATILFSRQKRGRFGGSAAGEDEWVRLPDLVTILSWWALRTSRTRQANRTLDTITASRTLGPFLALKEQQIHFVGAG